MGQRRRSRELALKCLYALETNPGERGRRLRAIADKVSSAEELAFADKLAAGVLENRAALDRRIAGYALRWSLERVALIERNILRLAFFEMFFLDPPTPPGAAIDEAVELSRKYGSDDSYRFVNGVLDRGRADLEAEKASAPRKAP